MPKDIIPSDLLKDIYEQQVVEQLRHSSIMELLGPLPPADPNRRSADSPYLATVGEFKHFLEENNIPDNAQFTDTGYECDGSYNFSWIAEEEDGN